MGGKKQLIDKLFYKGKNIFSVEEIEVNSEKIFKVNLKTC